MPFVASVLACVVIGVADGDSLSARCETPAGLQNINVRLAEIDAPEKGQPFGNRSKQNLIELCLRKPATLRTRSLDRYGRTVARVECAGVDAILAQVEAGFAWAYDHYATDKRLYELQQRARTAQRGLWIDSDPVAPWLWRRTARAAPKVTST
jgi:micrococcal nuclease